jgi:hypothetical protein
MTKQLIQAARQRVDSAPGASNKKSPTPLEKITEYLKVVNLKTLSRGLSSSRFGAEMGKSVYAFRVNMGDGTIYTILGSFQGGITSSAGKKSPPYGQYTRSEWNDTFRDLWGRATSNLLEFMPCEDGMVFFYVYAGEELRRVKRGISPY